MDRSRFGTKVPDIARGALGVLLGAVLTVATPVQAAGPGRRSGHDRGGPEGRAGSLVHDLDREPGDPAAAAGLRDAISGREARIFARRRHADGAEDIDRRPRRPHAGRYFRWPVQHDRAAARRAPVGVSPAQCRPISGRAQGSGRLLERDPDLRLRAGAQHRHGAPARRAQDAARSARSAVARQDGVESELDRRRLGLYRQCAPEHGRGARQGLPGGRSPGSRSSMSRRPRAPYSIRSSPANIRSA